ncbi:MAG TPA: DNA-directed RNA polymerase subunit E'' [Candidatus Nanoarchaeia archaeon]|nr:DNA-directed RNA polymerase subunit E'' [Candidatus Nanoarchaeia archaeon]
MALKAVKSTKELIESEEQQKYDSDDLTENFKGKLIVLNPEQSEIAKNVKINKKGIFAIKI